MFPPAGLTSPGQHILLTDQLSSPADFFLHRSLAIHLKENKHSKCVILSVSEGLARWKAIASRSNVNLSHHIESHSLEFVDALSEVQPSSCEPSQVSLRPLVEKVRSCLQSLDEDSPSLVILDDISSLEWIGFPIVELTRFARALSALCLKLNVCLIIRHHIVTPDEPDDLLRLLFQLCTYRMDVRPLSSGRSGAISGEIALFSGPATFQPQVKTIPRSRAVQYRLTDSGAVYFEKGTGQAIL